MYHMKKINNDDAVDILLPKCMYRLRNVIDWKEDNDINISQQVTKFLKVPKIKMSELQERQDLLLKKLDALYDRIKVISSYCKVNNLEIKKPQIKRNTMNSPGEIVFVVSPDNLPWFLDILQKTSFHLNITYHIHSSVPNGKIAKIMTFVKHLPLSQNSTGIVLRLIFKCADSEMKLSSMAVPIVGTVNILRYLSYIIPDVFPYNQEDFNMDGLMDLCHLLERSPEKNKEALLNKLFSQCNIWICNDKFSIVDLAAYNVIKQWKNIPKTVPKKWLDNCSKLGQ
ncbi:aminoacyl tRNA synthase complex-interacting multifunctional protein 2-like isoform X1 [Plodia interpunctella]|uniref:aminoacyl tRNA synthase complex-interacting multifunctional protein 2-like isoform X1 n=1 Tax=Plodia interpunctella TaxID=58824 RepID=UPI002368B4D7|nr:aminoacyl tRNA synthase complex-interacting multifunctional protein 2-like isoform X1 [Plodia interpunctella]